MTMNFNLDPYYDDFDETNNFYKVLFRPGYAVQTRELNQVQTILQDQINSVGKHLFKDGSVVIPGSVNYDSRTAYVKLQTTNVDGNAVASIITKLEKTTIVGSSSGTTALVIHAEPATTVDPAILYVRYLASGTTSPYFTDDESIICVEDPTLKVTSAETNSIGYGTVASITNGIYYVNGFFVKVFDTNVVLSKYTSTPTASVGIVWEELIITPEENETLLDNAYGSYNYAAPGAHRYRISTTFQTVDIANKPSNYIELLSIENGTALLVQDAPEYNVLEQELAKRTYAESGNYVVSNFVLTLRDQRKNFIDTRQNSTRYELEDVIQVTISSVDYYYKCIQAGTSGITDPSYITTYGKFNDGSVKWEYVDRFVSNDGISTTGDPSKYVIEVTNGSGVVKGYTYTQTGMSRLVNSKSRTYDRINGGTVNVYDGTYVLVKNVFSIPTTIGSDFSEIELYDQYTTTPGSSAGTKVGTAKIRWLEHDSGTSNYRLYLFDITMLSGYIFEKHCKQMYYNNTSGNDFTCDAVATYTTLSGSITAAGTAVTGTGTRFVTELSVGDYITVDQINYYRVTVITNNNSLTIGTTLTTTGSIAYVTKSSVNNTKNVSVYPLSHGFIRNIKGADDLTNDTRYIITRKMGILTSDGAGVITVTLSASGETFASIGNTTNYLVINNASGSSVTPSYAVNGDSTSLTISGLANTTPYTVFAAIEKQAVQRTKTLEIGTIDVITLADANAALITLGKSDCYSLLSVKQAAAFGAINSSNEAKLNVTSFYKFDSGQRSLYYDVGSISKTNSPITITGSLRIVFEYFSHGAGDYFSVDSYNNVIPYANIEPKLRDTLDFRPVKNDSGTGFDSSSIGILKSGYNITADYSYYLPRIDALVLSSNKSLDIINGTPSLSPKMPVIPSDCMALYYIGNTPYGGSPKASTAIKKVENKRYTMRDIGKLEDRISNVEYYVSLTMKEQQTANLSIQDSTGMDMYKNGFIVESFNDHGIGGLTDPDYRCFINSSVGELYPQYNSEVVQLTEVCNTTGERDSNNYVIHNGLITLPYEEVSYISNNNASRVCNINPFAVASFTGKIELMPDTDVWYDTVTLPTIYDKNY